MVNTTIPDNIITIFAILSILLNVVLSIRILREKNKALDRVRFTLLASTIGISLWVVALYAQLVIYSPDNTKMYYIFSAMGNLVIALGLGGVFTFVKYLVYSNIQFNHTLVLSTLFGMIFVNNIALIIFGWLEYDESLEIPIVFSDITNVTLVVYILMVTLYDLQTLRDEPLNSIQEKQVQFIQASIIIALLGNIPVIILSNLINLSLMAFAFIVLTIALVLLNYSFLIDPRIVFVLPDKTYLLMIVNDKGVLKYQRNFAKTSNDSTSAVLISGALKTMSTIMSEFYETEVEPDKIEFGEKLILFEWTHKYFIVVFSDRDSPIIRSAMKKVIFEISLSFGTDFEALLDDHLTLPIDDIVDRAFDFIY